jgi:DNA-binding IclR family transcriptional regulator
MRSYRFVTYYAAERAWGLGTAAFELGSAYLRTKPLERLGAPVLADLSVATGDVALLGILHGTDVLILGREQAHRGRPSVAAEVGVRVPAHLTGLGRAMLMELSEKQFRALYPPDSVLVRRAGRGPILVRDLRRELAQSRMLGYALDESLLCAGVTTIGAPVFSHENRPLAALSISFATSRHSSGEWAVLAAQVRASAIRLSQALGWEVSDVPLRNPAHLDTTSAA